MKERNHIIILLFIIIIVMTIWLVQYEKRIDNLIFEKNKWHSNYLQLWEKVVISPYSKTILNKPEKPKLQRINITTYDSLSNDLAKPRLK